MFSVVLDPSNVVTPAPVKLKRAMLRPSGEMYAGCGPGTENVRRVTPFQLTTEARVKFVSSQTAPAADGGPAIRPVGPPMVYRRRAVGGSKTKTWIRDDQNDPT